jgi:hypothetical protein
MLLLALLLESSWVRARGTVVLNCFVPGPQLLRGEGRIATLLSSMPLFFVRQGWGTRHTAMSPRHAGANPSFCSIKRRLALVGHAEGALAKQGNMKREWAAAS